MNIRLDHFVLQFIGVFQGVGGSTCVIITGICRVLAIVVYVRRIQ